MATSTSTAGEPFDQTTFTGIFRSVYGFPSLTLTSLRSLSFMSMIPGTNVGGKGTSGVAEPIGLTVKT